MSALHVTRGRRFVCIYIISWTVKCLRAKNTTGNLLRTNCLLDFVHRPEKILKYGYNI